MVGPHAVQVFGRRDDGLTTRRGVRRPKSAKARNRGKWVAAVPRALFNNHPRRRNAGRGRGLVAGNQYPTGSGRWPFSRGPLAPGRTWNRAQGCGRDCAGHGSGRSPAQNRRNGRTRYVGSGFPIIPALQLPASVSFWPASFSSGPREAPAAAQLELGLAAACHLDYPVARGHSQADSRSWRPLRQSRCPVA
jgi:hypothetical protein